MHAGLSGHSESMRLIEAMVDQVALCIPPLGRTKHHCALESGWLIGSTRMWNLRREGQLDSRQTSTGCGRTHSPGHERYEGVTLREKKNIGIYRPTTAGVLVFVLTETVLPWTTSLIL